MSPQDRQLLQEFLNQLTQVRGVAKDPEAEAMITRALAEQPDAPYLLVQRALLLEQALNSAKAEIAALQNQLRASPQGAPAFLDPNAWGNSGAARPAPAAPPSPVAQQPYQMPAQAQAPGSSPGFLRGGGMGGMLGNVAATAAGVAGGAFLFQGLEHLLGNHAGNGFLGQQSGFGSLTQPVDETINNFYGSDTSKGLADNPGSDTSNNLVDNPGGDTSSGLDDTLDSNFTDDSDDSLFS